MDPNHIPGETRAVYKTIEPELPVVGRAYSPGFITCGNIIVLPRFGNELETVGTITSSETAHNFNFCNVTPRAKRARK
jgi:hypothetical protein